MSEVLIAFGPFVFYATAPSFEKLKDDFSARWAPQERLGRKVAHQFLGPGEQTVELDGHIYPEALGGGNLIPAMKAAAERGAVFPLVAMSDAGLAGEVKGIWFIQRVSNERSHFGNTGARKIMFTVHLKEYGEDGILGGGLF